MLAENESGSRLLMTSHNNGAMRSQISAIPEEENGEYTYTEDDGGL